MSLIYFYILHNISNLIKINRNYRETLNTFRTFRTHLQPICPYIAPHRISDKRTINLCIVSTQWNRMELKTKYENCK